MTSVMVVSGFALPVSLAHAGVIHSMAAIMAMVGGGLVYGTSEFCDSPGVASCDSTKADT